MTFNNPAVTPPAGYSICPDCKRVVPLTTEAAIAHRGRCDAWGDAR